MGLASKYVYSMISDQIKAGKYGHRIAAFTKYSRFFIKSNENIAGYLKFLNPDHKDKALTVLSSGDHVLNLLAEGFLNIDSFDSNILTYYYALGLKKAMIIKYNYQEFIEISMKLYSAETSLEEITEIILDLVPSMDENQRFFWKSLANYNYRNQKNNKTHLNLLLMLSLNGCDDKNYLIAGNNYLFNEEKYNKTKENLMSANITFKNANAAKLDKNFKDGYDTILLSNIPDFFSGQWAFDWGYDSLLKYEEKLKAMTNDDAVIFLNYIFCNTAPLICSSRIKKEDLTDEEVKIIPSIAPKVKEDAILLLRKNNNIR